MKFLVLGTGGVGGYFGAKLAASGEDVMFVARGSHLQAMLKSGLTVNATNASIKVAKERIIQVPTSAGQADVILFCVKSFDTESAAELLNPILTDHSVVLCLQNGIDNEEIIQGTIRRGTVFGGAAYVSARITAPGVVTETGGLQRIVFGPLSGPPDDRALEILSIFTKADINASLNPQIEQELWRKFVFITSMGSMTTLTRLTQGEILSSPETMDVVFGAMSEAEAVGKAKGVDILPHDREKIIEGLKRFDPETRSSMYYDLVGGKPMEIEALNGIVVRLGQKLGVPTPIHRTIYAALLPHHIHNLRKRSG